MPMHKGGKGGTKKYGRNKVKCARYEMEGRREKNKRRHIATQKRKEEKRRAVMASLKGKKMDLISPAQNADPKGGPGGAKNSPSFGGKQGKGTKSHLAMDTPDKAGGGWTTGKK